MKVRCTECDDMTIIERVENDSHVCEKCNEVIHYDIEDSKIRGRVKIQCVIICPHCKSPNDVFDLISEKLSPNEAVEVNLKIECDSCNSDLIVTEIDGI